MKPLTDKSIRTDGKDCQTMDKSCQYYGTSLPKTCEDSKKTSDFEYRAFRAQIISIVVIFIYGISLLKKKPILEESYDNLFIRFEANSAFWLL